MNFLRRFFRFQKKISNKTTDLKDKVQKERKEDLMELKKINKEVKLLLKNGSIEVVIRNVRGVIKEIR